MSGDRWGDVSTVLCDLDGVIWLAHRPIDGSVEAVADLRRSGRRVLFVTNNSAATRAQHEARLAEVGIEATGDVASSAMAAARLVGVGERVLVAGGPGVVEAVASAGAVVVVNDGRVDPAGFDAVVVGLHRDFDFDRLAVASAAVRAGARLIGTNTDSTYPTPHGLQPGGGSILVAVATAAGTDPVVAGKPHQPMVDLITELLRIDGRRIDPTTTVMVGDRPETDGRFAARLGCAFALVRSGVPVAAGADGHAVPDVPVEVVADDLREVARRIVWGSSHDD